MLKLPVPPRNSGERLLLAGNDDVVEKWRCDSTGSQRGVLRLKTLAITQVCDYLREALYVDISLDNEVCGFQSLF